MPYYKKKLTDITWIPAARLQVKLCSLKLKIF